MTSLPLISHHLFVAAIDRQGRRREADLHPAETPAKARAIALDWLDWSEPLPELTPRPLCAVASPLRT
jgi:hypothetical protein